MPRVLTIGPDYQRLGGGIVAVLSTYAKYDYKFRFLPTYNSENNIINIIFFPWLVLKIVLYLLKNTDVQIVHIHGASYISFFRKYLLYLIIKKILKKKVIYHIHGAEFHLFYKNAIRLKMKVIKDFVEGSDGLIVLSKKWKIFFDKEFDVKNIFILNNTIPYPEITGPKQGEIMNFLFLGRIGKRKGIFDLLEAVYRIKSQIQNKAMFYVGGDGDAEGLLQIIQQYGLKDIVKFVGWISGQEKIKLLNKSNVYVLPSFNEGLPISILEAMSYHMPIISTAVGGIPEVVIEGENGFLIEPGNVNDIAKALLHCVYNKENNSKMGSVSSVIVQNFFPDKVISDLHTIYDKI